jgi:hypothetical protein
MTFPEVAILYSFTSGDLHDNRIENGPPFPRARSRFFLGCIP